MSTHRCFLIEPTGREARFLRRYASGSQCSQGHRYHNATVRIDDGRVEENPEQPPHEDPRWPTHCPCGYQFGVGDVWQLFQLSLYRGPDGTDYTIHDSPPDGVLPAPPGAMWLMDWCPGPKKHPGPFLWCMTPDGSWCIDGDSASHDGKGWARTGTPPVISVTPSILTNRYHGMLTDGVLTSTPDSQL